MKGVYDASKHTLMNFCLLVQKYSPPQVTIVIAVGNCCLCVSRKCSLWGGDDTKEPVFALK